jgi:hypothetical protein
LAHKEIPGQFAKSPRIGRAANGPHPVLGTDGKTLPALSANRVRLLDWPAARVRRTVRLLPPQNQPGSAHGDAADISPDGRWLITLAHREGLNVEFAADNVLDLWNAATGEHVRRLLASPGVARTVQ